MEAASPARLETETAGDALVVRLLGAWSIATAGPSPREVTEQVAPSTRRLRFEAGELSHWDSSVLTFIAALAAFCAERRIEVDRGGLPEGVQRLLALAAAVPERKGARRDDHVDESVLERIGEAAISTTDATRAMLAFIGESAMAMGRFFLGRARYRRSDLFVAIEEAGAEALPIVTLISFLVGLILAFVGAVQLQKFGAQIFVADLVGIAMVREMGAMMTGIVMAGRTGAAYAAALGSMKVTQEIDALRTMGVSPLDFLVLPRMLALFFMMPLLCVYSDVVGILGGAAVGTGMLGLSPLIYYEQTVAAVSLGDLAGGIFKASVYGILIAIAGCLRGMQSGNSSSAVGEATTSAVVTSIVFIISACGLFAVLFYILGI